MISIDNKNIKGITIGEKAVKQISTYLPDVQDVPFISQAPGSKNNTVSAKVLPPAKLLEKQGNTIVHNQRVQNPHFINTSNWTNSGGGTFTVSDGIAHFTASTRDDYVRSNNISGVVGHKYLFMMKAKSTTQEQSIQFGGFGGYITNTQTIDISWKILFYIGTLNNANSSGMFIYNKSTTLEEILFTDCECVDITQWFNGNDNIPADLLANPSHFSWYYNGSLSYDVGSLQNCNGRYLESPLRVDTGNETLKAFDKKLPSGLIERGTINQNLGDLTWVYESNYEGKAILRSTDASGIKGFTAKLICPKYVYASTMFQPVSKDKTMAVAANGQIYIQDSAYTDASTFKTAMNGVYLQAEASTKTTEQGTPFPEIILVNNDDMMSWLDTDENLVSIPQGCSCEYLLMKPFWTAPSAMRSMEEIPDDDQLRIEEVAEDEPSE